MKRDTQSFLALVRDAQDPTPADEARVLLALRASVAAGAASSVLASATLAPVRATGSKATLGVLGSKLAIGLVCTLAAFSGTGDTARSSPGA